ncbi:MAG: hypothetical protein AB4352_05920 [Hormoscilla sp.]
MVQTSVQSPYYRPGRIEVTSLRDPVLLQAARAVYYIYLEIPHLQTRRPLGVVINRETYRSLLIFKSLPILLPQECFVPLDDIESPQYD